MIYTENNIVNKKNTILSLVSMIITIILLIVNENYNNTKKDKKHKIKVSKVFVYIFKLLSGFIDRKSAKSKLNAVKQKGFPVKVEKAVIIDL